MQDISFKKGVLKGITAGEVASEAGCTTVTVYNNLKAGKGRYYEKIVQVIARLNKRQNQSVSRIIAGAFEVVDYDRDALTCTIALDDVPGAITIELDQDYLLAVAMAYGDINSYWDPHFEGGPHYAETHDFRKVSFPEWWNELVDETDRERYFMGAVIEKARDAMREAYKKVSK